MSRPPRPARRGRLVLVPARQDPGRTREQVAAGLPQDPPALLRVLLGARLRRARQAQGRSLRDVAAAAGVSIGHLSQVERGLAEASSEVLAALCRALGVPLHVLLRAAAVDLMTAPPSSQRSVVSLTAVRVTGRPAGRLEGGVQARAA